jgi:hypothetical protein
VFLSFQWAFLFHPCWLVGWQTEPIRASDGDTLVDAQALFVKLFEDFIIDFDHGFFRQSFSKSWECGVIGGSISKGSFRNFLKENLLLIWLLSSGSEGIRNYFWSSRHLNSIRGG